ncbi:MAG: hypothetical protein HYY06_12925 [Deltaproteobacteria bacterium]|nr:hypothetical protein [Deltaproteobacteria bacterium]
MLRRTLEEVVVSEGLVSPEEASRAADRAARFGLPLVSTLVSSNLVSEFDVAEALGRVLDLPVVDVAGGELDEEAIHTISADLAERRLLIPMGLDIGARVLRVALADPLDREGVAELEAATGMSVAPMVATLSSIGRAIQRYYHRSTTKVVAKPSHRGKVTVEAVESPEPDRSFGESTKKMAARAGDSAPPGTVPMHLLEEEASIEVRLRALILALEERGGLTHQEYLDALRRVLGER